MKRIDYYVNKYNHHSTSSSGVTVNFYNLPERGGLTNKPMPFKRQMCLTVYLPRKKKLVVLINYRKRK